MPLRIRRVIVAALSGLLGLSALASLAPSARADAPTPPDHLVIAAVWGANSDTAQWTNDWIELYNPTDHDITLGTVTSATTVAASYALCYRSVTAATQKCSSDVQLSGTVKAHHYFFVWYANAHSPADDGTYPGDLTPDLDVAVATAANGGQKGSNMGGCNTGGQVLLLDPNAAGASSAPTFKGDLSSADAKADGVIDGLGWTNASTTQPDAAETGGATTITGFNSGTTNGCVIARNFTDGVPVDTDVNRTDFSTVAPASFTIHSQISDHVAVAPVDNAEISRGEAMTPIQVQGSKGTGALTYAADGLPGGVSIDADTGVISGTPSTGDDLKDYPVTVTVSDSTPSEPDTATTSFTLTVSEALRVDAVDDVAVHKGAALTPIQVTAHGGTPPYAYAATGLPAGVDIDAHTGEISGTPTDERGKYTVHLTVTDSGADAAQQQVSTDFTLTEQAALTSPGSGDPLSGLRINEVVATGTPADDWVELYNTGAAVTAAAVDLSDPSGAAYSVPAEDIPTGGYVVIDGADLHQAGLDLAADDTLYLNETGDGSLLDQTSWTSYPATSWARYPDGTGDFAASKSATHGTANSLPATAATDHLVISAVWGANSDAGQWTNDWVQLYNPTESPIVLGDNDGSGTVAPNYYLCYRTATGTKCSTQVGLYGTVQPHHYFLFWYANAHTPSDGGAYPVGVTPDVDFSHKTTDNGNQLASNMGGCNTGGNLLLTDVDATAGGAAALTGDLSSATAKSKGVVDAVGWTNANVNEPTGYETSAVQSGTNNECVLARNFAHGVPVDSDTNSTDFTVTAPSAYNLQSQASQRVAITAVDDAEISLDEQMSPIQVRAEAIFGALSFSATGLPNGITINPSTGVISGTPDSADDLKDYPVTVTVGDGVASDTATTTFTLTVSRVLRLDAIKGLSVPKGAALSDIDPKGHGGTPGYRYTATGLPAGVTIDSSTGAITGAPDDALGRYKVQVTVTDSTEATASESFTIVELPSTGGPAAGDPLAGLKLNEVEATGSPAKDWIELHNTGAALTGAAVTLEDSEGDTYQPPARDIADGAYLVVDGSDLAAAGVDMAAKDTLYLAATDGTLLDQTAWTSYAPTSWARTTDGTGDFGVSAYPTEGASNSGAPAIHPNDLLVSEVNYDNNSTDYYEYSEVTNTTDHPIDFGAYGLTMTKSGAVMTFHDASDTSGSSPLVDPVIPAHGTQLFWWDENQYLGVKTTAQFLANYGLAANTPVVLVQGFSSMANSGGDHSYYISVNQGATPISQAWVDTPCAANTFNGTAVCTATNGNYAEHYEVPVDRTDPVAAVWYNSLHAGGDDIDYTLTARLSTPGTVDLEQLGFTRAVKISSVTSGAITLHNTSSAAVDLSGYSLMKNGADASYTLPAGTTIAAGDDLAIQGSVSELTFGERDYVTLLAPAGYAYGDGYGVVDTTGPFLYTLPYDASSGEDPVIDETTGLPLPPAGGLYRPAGISAANGTVYVSNTGDNVLAALANDSNTRIAGSLEGYGDTGDEGLATSAYLYQPAGTAEDADGNILIADSGDDVIREITPDGKIHRVAGTGVAGGEAAAVTSDSTPLTVNLWHPESVAVDSAGDVLIADTFDNRILKVTPAGAIAIVAGTGKAGYTGDGAAATKATLTQPAGVAVDAEDNVYIADSSNNVVRRVDALTGVITTVAGDYAAGVSNDCLGGFAGDGGPATSALLNDPQSVALDGAGDLFIADTFNNAIRVVTPDGTISTLVNASGVAGTENTSPTGSGAVPASAHLNTPYAVAVDQSTNALYIADTKNSAIAQVINAGEGGTAGGPTESDDALAVSSSGKAAAVCDALEHGGTGTGTGPGDPGTGTDNPGTLTTTTPTIRGTFKVGARLTAQPGTWKAGSATVTSFAYQWLRNGVAIARATSAAYTPTPADHGKRISVTVTGQYAGYQAASKTSSDHSVAAGTLTSAKPRITGMAKVGRTLTVHAGTWRAGTAKLTGRHLRYQWYAAGKRIVGAARATYKIAAKYRGKRIAVAVTGSSTGYTTVTRTSPSTAAVKAK